MNFRRWASTTMAVLGLIVFALVVIDLLGGRRFVPLTDHYDWLSFLGALLGGIVGGLFTFGGVYLTLQQQRETDRLQRDADAVKTRLSIMPLFEYAVSYDPKDFDNTDGQLVNETMPIYLLDGGRQGDADSFEFLYDIVIRNVGLGHALLTNVTLNFRDRSHHFIESQKYGFENFLVKRDSRRDLRHFLYAPRNSPRFADDPSQYGYAIEVLIQYEDLLGNKYRQKLLTSIAKGLYAEEDPATGGMPFASFHHAEPPTQSVEDLGVAGSKPDPLVQR